MLTKISIIQQNNIYYQQRQNQQEQRNGCVAMCLIIFSCIILILFIVEDCLSIALSAQKEDQEQIHQVAIFNICVTILKILIILSFICSLITWNLKSSFGEQTQYLGIFYLLLYICVFQIMIVTNFIPTEAAFAIYVICINSVTFFFIYFPLLTLVTRIVQVIEEKNILEESQILENQKKAIFALYLFMFYSLCKIILYIIIIIFNQNESMQYLVYSNICYHLIMIIFWLKITQTIRSDKERKYNQQNYIYLIYKVSKIKSNFIFLLLSWLSLGITFYCFIKTLGNTYETDTVLNFDIFIQYDCFIVQLLSQFLFIMLYCFHESKDWIQSSDEQNINITNIEIQNEPENQQLNFNQQIFIENPSDNRKPFIFNVQIDESLNCTICLQKLINQPDLPVVQLKCYQSHVFHQQCIEKWLEVHQTCPLCSN